MKMPKNFDLNTIMPKYIDNKPKLTPKPSFDTMGKTQQYLNDAHKAKRSPNNNKSQSSPKCSFCGKGR